MDGMTLSVGFLIELVGALILIVNFASARKKDTQTEDGKMEEIRTSLMQCSIKLDQVCGQITAVQGDIKSMQNSLQHHDTDIAVLRRDLHSITDRIDKLEEMVK